MILEHGYHCKPMGGAHGLREQLEAYGITDVYVRICGVVGDCVAVIPNQRFKPRTKAQADAEWQMVIDAYNREIVQKGLV